MFLAMIPGNENQFLSPLMPAWNNFLLLSKSLLGIPHERSRRTWTYAQTYPIPGDIKKDDEDKDEDKDEDEDDDDGEEEEEITISLTVFER